MERKVVRRRRRSSGRAPVFILTAMNLILVGVIAATFSAFVMKDLETGLQNPTDALNVPTELFPGQATPGEIVAQALAERRFHSFSSSQEEEPPGNEVYVTQLVGTRVPKTAPAESGYFDDAVFIGDSISKGIKISKVIPAKNMVVEQNVRVDQLVNGEKVYGGKTVYEAIDAQVPNPGKIYVLLGTNALPGMSNESQMEWYAKLIDNLKAKYPAAILYVESLTPKQQTSDYDRKFTRDKINDFNARLEALAAEKGVYYLNVQEALLDENGWLRSDYAAPDGLHLVNAGHKAMYSYYKTHAVGTDGYAKVVQ